VRSPRQRGIEQITLAFLDAVAPAHRSTPATRWRTHELCERIVKEISG